MMIGLLKKDVIANRSSILINIGVLLAMNIYLYYSTFLDFLIFFNIIYIVLITISPISMDDKTKSDRLFVSVPITRKRIVFSRYLYSVLVIISMLLLLIGYIFILSNILTPKLISFDDVLDIKVILSIAFFAVIAVCFFIPFIYRFGQMGIMIGLMLTVSLSLVAFVVTFIASRGGEGSIFRNTLRNFFENLEKGSLSAFYDRISVNIGPVPAIFLMLGSVIAAIAISIALSVFIYRKKEF